MRQGERKTGHHIETTACGEVREGCLEEEVPQLRAQKGGATLQESGGGAWIRESRAREDFARPLPQTGAPSRSLSSSPRCDHTTLQLLGFIL